MLFDMVRFCIKCILVLKSDNKVQFSQRMEYIYASPIYAEHAIKKIRENTARV